jgi:hypothetical protein
MKVPGPPCTRPNGSQDWGPHGGPRWRGCSEEVSSTSSEAAVESSEEAFTEDAATGGEYNALKGPQLWMFVVAGSVVSAMVAIGMGQRQPLASSRHGMTGSVMRRVGAVSAFAAGAFAVRGQNQGVEMQAEIPAYRLDMCPEEEGLSSPSANV